MDHSIRLNHEPSRAGRVLREIVILLVIAAAACGIAFAAVHFAAAKVRMPGKSMEATLSDGDLLLVNTALYRFRAPQRGDIVAFQMPDSGAYSVKRIVGLPGDRVRIAEGILLINDEPYQEPAKVDPMKVAGTAAEEILLGEDEYFVLGDNRGASEDSRFASVGLLSRAQLTGKVWLRLSPSFGIADRLNEAAPAQEETKESNGS
ncbi:MAG: signal peptidase I [Lachnospiraceae bacterium]|nr:signal peptidase I [Lachnospiraceae bacterium]MBQ9593378.1 signal peptidase I [Lachnospiraceae bacterium]